MNSRLKAAVLGTVLMALTQTASADLLVYDGFDYAAGPLQPNAGGEGNWEGGWFSSTYTAESGSLTLPNMPFAVVGGHTSGAGTANRDITEISTASPGTYYLSYLSQRTGFNLAVTSGQWADFYLRDGFTQVVNGGITSSTNFHLRYVGGDSGTSAGQGANSTSPFFLVYKIVLGDTLGTNSLSMSWYSDGNAIPATEPVAWDLEVTGQSVLAGNFNKLTLWSGTNLGYSAQYDEIRLATTYGEAVPLAAPPIVGDLDSDGFVGISDLNIVLGNWNAGTPPTSGESSVPEPATAGLIALAGLGIMSRRGGGLS